jgi:hypothetical protein
MIRVKVYSDKGMPRKVGVGIFAREFMNHFPSIPVEDDGRLNNPQIRENFIEQIFTMKRWREIASGRRQMGKLVDFTPATSSCSWLTARKTTAQWENWLPKANACPWEIFTVSTRTCFWKP